jgi:hypothetical protein
MNDRIKHKQMTEQMNHQTANPKANASVFLFSPTAHFLKSILANRTNSTFGFCRHESQRRKNQKSYFLSQLTENNEN